ncbi:MAG: CHAT domain-containing protein [Chloroflexi bacterium]|nr:CHAT domain-containing protein [Chloroflexota bacterium]
MVATPPVLSTKLAGLLDGSLDIATVLCGSSDEEIRGLVDGVKREANRYWSIDPNRSLQLAEMIVQIGETCDVPGYVALGIMARGDALKLLGQLQDAWKAFEQAAARFLAIGDEVGWARSQIGPLFICVQLNEVDTALANAEKAHAILARHQQPELLVSLANNRGLVFTWLGNYQDALAVFSAGIQTAQEMGTAGEGYLGNFYANIGYTYQLLADFHRAEHFYKQALAVYSVRNDTHWITTIEMNLASIELSRGQYRRALQRSHRAYDYAVDRSPQQAVDAQVLMVRCYCHLNRYREARDLARELIGEYQTLSAHFTKAMVLFQLSLAEAGLSNWSAAQTALDDTELIFHELGADVWLATIQLHRAVIAVQQGQAGIAYREASAAAEQFEQLGLQADYAEALLRRGQALIACGETLDAESTSKHALRLAQKSSVAWMRYSAHLLVGRVAKAQHDVHRARRHFQAAVATVDRVQRGLTITLRPGFQENKTDALRELVQLSLDAGRIGDAFQTLERAKSQGFQSYLTSRDSLRWSTDDPTSQALIEELERLREEHRLFHRQVQADHAEAREPPTEQLPDLHLEISRREKRMRAITEQLFLRSPEDSKTQHLAPLSVDDIQSRLSDDALLVEYYNDGSSWWAFALDREQITVHALAVPSRELDDWLSHLHFNITCALKAGTHSASARPLTVMAHRLLENIFRGLLQPLESRFRGRERLVIVPFGSLHYLPFHLLRTDNHYLIERHDVVVLPAAGLITHPKPHRDRGALVLAHSREGSLPQTQAEADLVQRLFGGSVRGEQAAQRKALQQPPCQILHIAAHGEFRMDEPDLAYIELADGLLYADDLMQHDLSYELVTLSACETGRAKVVAGDDLIGLGRGCLYAGASALLVSLWRVDDIVALALMNTVYRALSAGASKATALGDAQRAFINTEDALHPAFWGAFQLVGNADPLSS